jgi:CubicO group peptidase (beta-lactamase class C family)
MTMHAGSPSAQPDQQSGLFAPAYNVLSEAISARAFPGCAFGLFADGKVMLQDALGQFTYDSDSQFVAPETVYDIASITKVAATTAAAMLLSQRGQLDLSTPIGELLPGFVVGRSPGEHARLVTIRHLLSHNSGLPGYVELFRPAVSPEDLFRACLKLPLEAEPGTRAEYSDMGFILLGKALEILTRESLESLTDREIFQRLAMKATRFNPPLHERASIPPTEHDQVVRNRRIQGEVQDEHAWLLRGVSGHAGLFSNVPDLLRFAEEILKSLRPETSKAALFAKTTVDEYATRQAPPGSSRALGWDTPSEQSSAGQYFSSRSIGHLGYSGCSLWIDLEVRVAVVLLTNRTWPDRQNQLIRQVRPAFHNAVREALLASHQ